MVVLILFLAAVTYFGYRTTTAEDREQLLKRAIWTVKQVVLLAQRRRAELQPVRDRLRTRTPIALIVPTLVAVNVGLFVLTSGDRTADGLLAWGASVGPLTTNGGWWRLLTSIFLHASVWHLLVNVITLLTAGVVVERYAGSLALLTVYLAAGVLAGLVNIWQEPVAVTVSASGAIFGVYGLLIAAIVWTFFRRQVLTRSALGTPDGQGGALDLWPSALRYQAGPVDMPCDDGAAPPDDETIRADQNLLLPMPIVTRLAVPAAVLLLYSLGGAGLVFTAKLTALGVGLAAGLFLTREVREQKPTTRQIAIAFATACIVAIAAAVPVRAIADVKPEMERIAKLETRVAGTYGDAYDKFKKGKITGQALVQVIERTILPDLQSADRRLKALQRVPPEHQPLVADATQYVQLRTESWRLRADGLRKLGTIPQRDAKQTGPSSDAAWRTRTEAQYRTNLATFGKAEGAERASLAALHRITPWRE